MVSIDTNNGINRYQVQKKHDGMADGYPETHSFEYNICTQGSVTS